MIYGYARVSTDGQSVDAQVRQLTKAGCKNVVRETASGRRPTAPEMTLVRTPGRRRRFALVAITLIAVTIAGLLTRYTYGYDLGVAFAIFLVSLLAFSLAAMISFDCINGWRAVDYIWVCASFIAIIFALASVSEAARQRELESAKMAFKSGLSTLISTSQTVSLSYCTDAPGQPLADVQRGICERIPYALTGMEAIVRDIDTVDSTHYWIGNVPSEWWDMLLPPEIESRPPPLPDSGYWPFLIGGIQNANGNLEKYKAALVRDWERRNSMSSLLAATGVRYWYFIVAFFVGLRLSRTTAELLQARASSRLQRQKTG